MNTPTLLLSLFQYKAWADHELFQTLQALDPDAQHEPLHAALRLLNHIYVVDRIFATHLQGIPHDYSSTNTKATPTLAALSGPIGGAETPKGTIRWARPEAKADGTVNIIPPGGRGRG